MSDHLTDVERIVRQVRGHLPRLLFVLAGPSGVGKNTIIKKLLTNNPYSARVHTYTTRKPREEEIPGEQYHFVTPEQFRTLALEGRLMEADAQIAGHDVYRLGDLYSMPADLYEEIPSEKHIVIAEVDIYGMRLLKKYDPDCVTIFVTAPPDVLIARLRERSAGDMDDQTIAQRMQIAREQIQAVGEFDYLVFNEEDDLEHTLTTLEGIIAAERSRVRGRVNLEETLPAGTFDIPVNSS